MVQPVRKEGELDAKLLGEAVAAAPVVLVVVEEVGIPLEGIVSDLVDEGWRL
ncbi:hypothetical protein D3C87_1821130 [compost metagenome]